MDGQAILTVSAAVIAFTQLMKWGFVPDKYGPFAVLFLSLLGVAFWAWTQGDFQRATAFAYFAGFVAVATSSAGVYGFVRAGVTGVTSMMPPPSGAGAGEPKV